MSPCKCIESFAEMSGEIITIDFPQQLKLDDKSSFPPLASANRKQVSKAKLAKPTPLHPWK